MPPDKSVPVQKMDVKSPLPPRLSYKESQFGFPFFLCVMCVHVCARLHVLVHILKTFIEAGFWLNPEFMDVVTQKLVCQCLSFA